MTRSLIIGFLTILLSFGVYAQDKMSVYTRLMLGAHNKTTQSTATTSSKSKIAPFSTNNDNIPVAKAFITLHEGTAVPHEALDSLQVTIHSEIDDILSVTIPIENFDKVAELDEIQSVSLAKTIKPRNDNARSATQIDDVHNSVDLPQEYKGKDVIVGIVDVGLDFNHINFKDSSGKSRVKLAGTYNSSSGTSELIRTEEEIAALTTDYVSYSHGTHVAGIAAGSYTANNYHGMAPESDLVLYGLGEDMTDANIINGITAVFNYADTVGKPAVINISLGNNTGPHDGSTTFNLALDKLTREGKIVVMAVGNEGRDNIYLNSTFTGSSLMTAQLSTIITCDGTSYDNCVIDTWSRNASHIGVQFFIYNTYTKQEVLTSSIFNPTVDTYKEMYWTSSDLTKYFTGAIGAGALLGSNNRYETMAVIKGEMTSSIYRIGLRFYGAGGTQMESWAYPYPTEFANLSNSAYTAGTSECSYNDMGCGEEAINIGAYTTKRTLTGIGSDGINGNEVYTFTYTSAVLNDIATFSSYGTDLKGRSYPDVVAPGFALVSSVNAYDYATVSTNSKKLIDEVSVTGESRKYHWGDMLGTSMATPVATGTVALWLQANPNLTPQEVRSIMKETATTDEYTQSASIPLQWGAGKLNAKAGLLKILQNSAISDISLPENTYMVYPNPSNGNFSVFAQGESVINISIFSLNGAQIYSDRQTTDNGLSHINLNGVLSPGFYLIKVEGSKTAFTSRLIIK